MQDSWKNAEIWVTDQLFAAGPALSRSIGILPKAMVGRGSTEAAIDKVSGVEKAVEFIHRNADRPFGLKDLLEICTMPKRTFEQEFSAKLGIDPYSFINRCRVERACMLLSERKKRLIKDVASMSGFNSERRFRIIFRSLMGVSPAVYQRKRRKGSRLEWDVPGKDKALKTTGAPAG